MRPWLIALCFCVLIALRAKAQTWHLDEKPLPQKIASLPKPERQAILKNLEPRIKTIFDDADKSKRNSSEYLKALDFLHTVTFQAGAIFLRFVAAWDSDSELCGATGNCSVWVLDRHNQILLESSGKAITVLSSYHRSMPDIVISIHDSASETDRERWYFDGKKYILSWCGTTTWGALGEYVRPHTYSHTCQQ